MKIANICDRKKINHRKVKKKKINHKKVKKKNSSNKSTRKYSKSKKVLNKPSKKETKRKRVVREDKQENSQVWRVDTLNICWTHKHKLRSILHSEHIIYRVTLFH